MVLLVFQDLKCISPPFLEERISLGREFKTDGFSSSARPPKTLSHGPSGHAVLAETSAASVPTAPVARTVHPLWV